MAREAGRKRNSGDNPNRGTGKDLLAAYVFLCLLRGTISKVSARIPLQSALRAASFPPGEALRRSRASVIIVSETIIYLIILLPAESPVKVDICPFRE